VPKETKPETETWGKNMSPEFEMMVVVGWGTCHRRLDRLIKQRSPNVNFKNEDGETALHIACAVGASEMVQILLDANADPNVPSTSELKTPLEVAIDKHAQLKAEDEKMCNWDTVMRLDDTAVAVRPDYRGHEKCKAVLQAKGAVEGKIHTDNPNITPNGSVNGGAPSELRAYDKSKAGATNKLQSEN